MEGKNDTGPHSAKVISLIDRSTPAHCETDKPAGTLMASYLSFTTLDQMLDDHFREMEEYGD